MKLKDKRRWHAGAIILVAALGPAALFMLLALWEPLPVRSWRDLVFDSYQRLSPRPYDPSLPVRVVAIDDESLQRIGQWPWPRARVAELIDRLTEAGAAAVAVDVLFAEAERGDPHGSGGGDALLAAAMARGRVVLGLALAERGSTPAAKAGFATLGDDARLFAPAFRGALLPVNALVEASAGLGVLNWTPDRDLVVREIPTVFKVGDALLPSLGIETLRVAQGASTVLVRASNASGETALGRQTGISAVKVGDLETSTGRDGSIRIRYAGTHPERRIAAWQILSGAFDRSAVAGAIMLLGATATALSDVRATPLEPAVPGIDIHAEAIESLLQGQRLTRPDFMPGLEAVLILVGGFFVAVVTVRLSPLPAAVLTQGWIWLMIGGSALAYLHAGQLFDPVGPGLAAFASSALASVLVHREADQERRQIREAFSRYVAPAVVETLASDPSRLTLGGEMKPLTVLFSDIRGFTARSENLPPEDVVRFLNEVHTPMTAHVLATGGTLDKFIGDGMMAFWNAPLDVPDHVRAALRCALLMQGTLRELNERFEREARQAGRPHIPLGLGIGIHTGPACVGNVGSHQRFDYSAIGDTVNAAARIEPLCKPYGVPIIASAEVAAAAPDFAFLLVDLVQLRGRQQESRLFVVHGDETAATAAFRDFKIRHDRAVTLAVVGHPGATEALGECAEDPLSAPYRQLYRVLAARIAERRLAAEAHGPAAAPVSVSA